MDFIAKSNRQGFFGKDQNQNQNQNQSQSQNQNQNHNQFMIRGKLPFSSSSSTSSSSSSSSQPQKSLVPLTFHHHHHHQQQQRGSWLENKFQPQQPSAAEEISSFRIYAGGTANLEIMDTSPAAGNNGDGDADAADDDNDIRRGDSSFDGLGLGVGGGGGGGGASGSTEVGLVVEREHMFDKVVTPSDVGKLNRLVIPKQHAEKYFPLDSSTNEKGLLLNFEDRNGKPWRFRYSYWNSSQSYVMTKGWSRFVKEKKLDAGDIVSFQRGVGELGKDRLFIDWRRRPDAPELPPSLPTLSHHLLLPQQQQQQQYFSGFHRSTTHPWSPHFLQPQAAALRDHSQHFSHLNAANYQPHLSSYGYSGGSSGGPYSYNSVVNPCSSSVIYLRSAAAVAPLPAGMVQVQSGVGGGGGGGVDPPMVFESVPVVHGKAAAKRLRLFGVNMDCPISELDECEILSSTTTTTITPHAATIAPPHLSSTPIPPLQLRLFNSSPLPAMHSDMLHKANASNKSFGFDI